jgi:phytoene dehydrogenase-like protein
MAPRELWADDFVDGVARADIVRDALCDQRADAVQSRSRRDSADHDANFAWLRRFSPNLANSKILARVVESPLDLERRNPHNRHGSCHGGAQTLARR